MTYRTHTAGEKPAAGEAAVERKRGKQPGRWGRTWPGLRRLRWPGCDGLGAVRRVVLRPYGVDMQPPRLTHVRVNVRDLAAAIDWYQRLLGCAR